MKCTKCNKTFDDGMSFCPYCGTPVKCDNQSKSTQSNVNSVAPKKTGKLLYTAKRSIWYCGKEIIGGIVIIALTVLLAIILELWVLLLIGLPIGILSIVLAIIKTAHYSLNIYDDKVVERYGILNTHEKQSLLTPIIGVTVSQSLWGRLFNYGDIHVDKIGKRKWDVNMTYIKNPNELKKFFETFITQTDYDKVGMFIAE